MVIPKGPSFKELCPTRCYLFKKPKLFLHQLHTKNSGPVLFWNCFLLSVATDGKDGCWSTLEKVGPTFWSFTAVAAKITKKALWLVLRGRIVSYLPHNFIGAFCVWSKALSLMTSVQNSPKTVLCSSSEYSL